MFSARLPDYHVGTADSRAGKPTADLALGPSSHFSVRVHAHVLRVWEFVDLFPARLPEVIFPDVVCKGDRRLPIRPRLESFHELRSFEMSGTGRSGEYRATH